MLSYVDERKVLVNSFQSMWYVNWYQQRETPEAFETRIYFDATILVWCYILKVLFYESFPQIELLIYFIISTLELVEPY